MLNIIWDTRGYFFWLLVISLLCWVLERLAPWRSRQKARMTSNSLVDSGSEGWRYFQGGL